MSNKSGFRGYIASRQVRGVATPQSIQNLAIREYAKKNNLTFLLSATEYAMESCYMMLESVLADLPQLEGMIAFSLFMLPQSSERRLQVYNQFIKNGAALHTALEGLVLTKQSDIALFEDLFAVENVAAKWEPV